MDKKYILAICGPSGSGKSTIINTLSKANTQFVKWPSVTDREMRPNESQNNPYIFVSSKEFDELIHNKEMLEYETQPHNQKRYGKSKRFLPITNPDQIILTELRLVQIEDLRKNLPDFNIISFYIHIDDIEEFKNRLIKRGDSLQSIENRIKTTTIEEQQTSNLADYTINSYYSEIAKTMEEFLDVLKYKVGLNIK